MKNKIDVEEIKTYIFCDNPISQKYKLYKLQKYSKLIKSEEIKTIIERQKDIKIISKRQPYIPDSIKKDTEKFITVMENKIPKDNLKNLYLNMSWVNIKILRLSNLFSIGESYGSYTPTKNKITLTKKYKTSTIYHELFHLCSSNPYIRDDSTGFKYNLKRNSIGISLNEGYTEILVKRYFNESYDEDDLDTYEFERIIATAFEEIVGINEMEKFYFKSDLHSLIHSLKYIYTVEEVIHFLITFDYIPIYLSKYYIADKEAENLNSSLDYMICFLLKGYCYKIMKLNNTKEENELLINEYINKIVFCYQIKYHEKLKFNFEAINSYVNYYMGCDVKIYISQNKKNML